MTNNNGASSSAIPSWDDDFLLMDLANPKFFTELTKTNMKNPYYITVPKEIWGLIDETELVVHLMNKGKKWETRYINHPGKKYIENFEFLMDNDLMHGDILGFELTNKTPLLIKLSVYINRKPLGGWNPRYRRIDAIREAFAVRGSSANYNSTVHLGDDGYTADNPINLD